MTASEQTRQTDGGRGGRRLRRHRRGQGAWTRRLMWSWSSPRTRSCTTSPPSGLWSTRPGCRGSSSPTEDCWPTAGSCGTGPLVEPGRVVTASGEEIAADYVVLATGSSYPFPAKTDLVDTERRRRAGPGDPSRPGAGGSGPPDRCRTGRHRAGRRDSGRLARQVDRPPRRPPTTSSAARSCPSCGPNSDASCRSSTSRCCSAVRCARRRRPSPASSATFTVTTESGADVTADIWFRCYGVVPNSDYLGEALARPGDTDGFVEVGPTLQVAGPDDGLRPGRPVHGRRQDGRLRRAPGRHRGRQHHRPGLGELRARRTTSRWAGDRRADRARGRSGTVPGPGRDRRARGRRRREGPGHDGRSVRRPLRTGGRRGE